MRNKGNVRFLHRIENPSNKDLIFIEIQTGEYFGEDSLLSKLPKVSKATVSSDWCRIIAASELHIKKILTEDPEVAMRFLNHLAKTVRLL